MRVLVTDGEQRAALAVVRSLGRAAHHVAVSASRRRSLAGYSRYCATRHTTADPLRDPDSFERDLLHLAVATHAEVLLPITDAALTVALGVKNLLEDRGVAVPFAALADYRAISDKREVLLRAQGVGIKVPRQQTIASPDHVDTRQLEFPIVVKPSRSVVGGPLQRMKTSVQYATDTESLLQRLSALAEDAYPILLQEKIDGPGVGIFLLRWEGETAAAFSHRRLREKPPSGGVSVLRESFPMDQDLLERCVSLLDTFNWRGPAMVEFKLQRETGIPYLMEINGRYWGSLQLAVDAGVDFPAIHLDLAAGIPRQPASTYRAGVVTRWVMGDLDHVIARVRHSREELGLPPRAPGAGRVLLQFLYDFRPGVNSEISQWSDPLPAAFEVTHWLSGR